MCALIVTRRSPWALPAETTSENPALQKFSCHVEYFYLTSFRLPHVIAMASIKSLQDLQEHLQYWDPPEDVQKVFQQFASYEKLASFEKLEGQHVHRCNDGGLDAAIEPVLQKLQLKTVNFHIVWIRGCADSHWTTRTSEGMFGGCMASQTFEIRARRHTLSLFSSLQAWPYQRHLLPLDESYTSTRAS